MSPHIPRFGRRKGRGEEEHEGPERPPTTDSGEITHGAPIHDQENWAKEGPEHLDHDGNSSHTGGHRHHSADDNQAHMGPRHQAEPEDNPAHMGPDEDPAG